MKEEDHSLFSVRGGKCAIAINTSFEQLRKASWPYRLESKIFIFFDVIARRKGLPEKKYISCF